MSRLKDRLNGREPLVTVGISRENLLHNLDAYKKRYPGLGIAPVLKSNAYGHDLGLVARLLDDRGIAFFMVDSLYEARRLRRAGVRSRVVVMGYARPEELLASGLSDTDFGITDLEQLRQVASRARHPLRIHLKLDTGMHRQGILPEDLPEAIALIKANPHVALAGVASHFASADEADETHARVQLSRWNEMRAILEAAFPGIEYEHLSATKGARFAEEAGTNVMRLGIGLYGYDTSPAKGELLKPVLELRSVIASLRTIPAGEAVGYNATHRTAGETTIATIPAGYYEGVDRRLSNKGAAIVQGRACPIVGRVSMNMVGVDVSLVPESKIGDEVILISRDLGQPNSIPAIAKLVSTPEYGESEYVIPTHIPPHLKRVLE